MVCGKGFCHCQLFPDVAGQIFVRRHPCLCDRISEDNACQFFGHFLLCLSAKFCHKRHIDLCFFSNGECQGFTRSIHRGDGFRLANSAFRENICQPLEVFILVQNLKRCQQTIAAILPECPFVGGAVDKTILRCEPLILVFQLSLQQFHFGIRTIVQLAVQQFLCGFPQGNHPQHTLCRDRRQVNLVHIGVFTVIDLSVHIGVTEILHVRICRKWFCVLVKFIVRDFRLSDFRMDVLNGCFQLLCKVCALDGLDRGFPFAVLCTFSRDLTQHHFRMLRKILVDGVSLRRCAKVYPLCPLHCRPVTLLQEQNVSYNTCVRIALERIVWQANCTDQIGTVGKILSDRGILFIHRTAGSDYRHYAARTNKVKTFCNKVIMDEEVVAVIPLIRHFVIAERHITHHTIKETVRELHCFKALHCNFVLLIKLLCNAS